MKGLNRVLVGLVLAVVAVCLCAPEAKAAIRRNRVAVNGAGQVIVEQRGPFGGLRNQVIVGNGANVSQFQFQALLQQQLLQQQLLQQQLGGFSSFNSFNGNFRSRSFGGCGF